MGKEHQSKKKVGATPKLVKKVLLNFDEFLFNCFDLDKWGFTYKCSEQKCVNYFKHLLEELIQMTNSQQFKNNYLLPSQGNDHRHSVNNQEHLKKIISILKRGKKHSDDWYSQNISFGSVYQTSINAGGARLFFTCFETNDYFEIRPLFLDLHHVVYPNPEKKYDEQYNSCFFCLGKHC